METIINTERLHIRAWLDDAEAGALEQAKNLANLPFAYHHIALMPDCHQGYGMPIGGVLATRDVIVPNAVGVDIGCGMRAVQTSLTEIDADMLKEIVGQIRRLVPVGFNHQTAPQAWAGFDVAPQSPPVQQNLQKARVQLGTLGGGNHFIEIQKGSDGRVWIMLHSGSRNFGFKIAQYYSRLAQSLCAKWFSAIPQGKGDDNLAFLPLDSVEGVEYEAAMNYALTFAEENRKQMMQRICTVFAAVAGCGFDPALDVHHNFAAMEHHFGANVMVHRKGATSARNGQTGIIPGSQGTKSYIVHGLGNPYSFCSCSHGAGRAMSRTAARKGLSLADEQKRLDNQGIIHGIRSEKDLDEAASAYKDIAVVMARQADLVAIDVELTPLAVIKG
ncbi:MAG: RtcB family protein [Deltaproteobacteria bacterium]|nr:RtcB family protein [Deltaproteobacteria bacterium]